MDDERLSIAGRSSERPSRKNSRIMLTLPGRYAMIAS